MRSTKRTLISGIGPSTSSRPPTVTCDDATNSQNSVGSELSLQREQYKCRQNHDHGREADRHNVQCKYGEQDKHYADRSGNDGAGMIEFRVKREHRRSPAE